jgi:hypothetical protein
MQRVPEAVPARFQMIDVVAFLESALLPELRDLGVLIEKEVPTYAVELFSIRHADELHAMGMSCFPKASSPVDPRCVALIVNVIKIDSLTLKGAICWQAPSLVVEAETAIYRDPGDDGLAKFCRDVRQLYNSFKTAVTRGQPRQQSRQQA